jgi:hypothetical protein
MKKEISIIQSYIQREFVAKKRSPDRFRLMCISAGAPALFDTILSAITAPIDIMPYRVNLLQLPIIDFIIISILSYNCNLLVCKIL